MAVPETTRVAALLDQSFHVTGNLWSLIATNSHVSGPRDQRRGNLWKMYKTIFWVSESQGFQRTQRDELSKSYSSARLTVKMYRKIVRQYIFHIWTE